MKTGIYKSIINILRMATIRRGVKQAKNIKILM
jgi:hypothetical protein